MVRPKKVSDEKILEIARECFLQKGSQVSTQEIAEKSGLSQAALFKRFKTKEDLYLAAVASKEIFTKVMSTIAWVSANPKKGNFVPQLAEMLTRVSTLLCEVLPRILALQSQRSFISPEKFLSSMKKPPPLRVLEAIVGFVKRAQENGQIRADATPEALAMQLMGAIQGRVFFTRILSSTPPGDDDVYIQEIVRNFWSGIAPVEKLK